jgi:hypothetical protein
MLKEQASSPNVVRITITLKEEGLEWATQASETDDVSKYSASTLIATTQDVLCAMYSA